MSGLEQIQHWPHVSGLTNTADIGTRHVSVNQVLNLLDDETYPLQFNVMSRSQQQNQTEAILKSTTNFKGETLEISLLCEDQDVKTPNNYSAPGQLHFRERRLSKDNCKRITRRQNTVMNRSDSLTNSIVNRQR